MSVFGELEKLFSEVIYPAWPLFAALAAALGVSAGYAAYRLGWHRVAMRHRLITGAAVIAVLAVAAPVGYYTISPLFERTTVCEASPLAGAGAGSEKCEDPLVANPDDAGGDVEATATPAPVESTPAPQADGVELSPTPEAGEAFEPRVVRQGEFAGADDFHFGEGQALLIETAPGEYTLRFENFSVRNGPDLFVYLSPSADGYSDGALELGGLKGTDGAFNYDVPAGTDVSQFESAIVWCKAFSVLFATAAFEAAQ